MFFSTKFLTDLFQVDGSGSGSGRIFNSINATECLRNVFYNLEDFNKAAQSSERNGRCSDIVPVPRTDTVQ